MKEKVILNLFPLVMEIDLKYSTEKLATLFGWFPEMEKLWLSSEPFQAFLWCWMNVKVVLLINTETI